MHILTEKPIVPTSVNPMLMTDEEFATYRQIGDDEVSTEAATVFTVLDQAYLYKSLSSLIKNSDVLDLTNLQLNSKTWDVPEESKPTWKKVAENFLESYFNDPPVDEKNRPRTQNFVVTDDEKIVLQNAAKFFCCHMTEATLALAVRSLLKQYAAYNSTMVLIATRLLPDYPHRRILSTMQFVMDVMDLNAFEPEGRGIKAIQKLRLIHAMIRERLNGLAAMENKTEKWNSEVHGVPINQQDMLFAIHTFSIEVLNGMIASGEDLSEADKCNYYYAWHIIGRMLGVSAKINPTDINIGIEVQSRIYAKEFTANNPNGPELATPLIKFLDDLLPLANRAGVLGVVKKFNDKKDYDPIFKNILKVELAEASSYYTTLYKIGDTLRHLFTNLKYFFTPKKMKSSYLSAVALNQHKFFNIVINAEKTWSAVQFRIADGFGQEAAKENEILREKAPPLWIKLWHAIKKKIFG